jgi:hypothetical protein
MAHCGRAPPCRRRATRGSGFALIPPAAASSSGPSLCNAACCDFALSCGPSLLVPGLRSRSVATGCGGPEVVSRTTLSSDIPPTASANKRRAASLERVGPKPGTPSGALKSQAFSASPMKLRIAGSADQARRSAARASSTGTPGCRKTRMSVLASIVSMGGKDERSIATDSGVAERLSP